MSTPDENNAETSSQTPEPGTDSTVTDWHGQDVERDVDAAEEALDRADGDEERAEEIFDDTRPPHQGDTFDVPASEREGSLVEPDED